MYPSCKSTMNAKPGNSSWPISELLMSIKSWPPCQSTNKLSSVDKKNITDMPLTHQREIHKWQKQQICIDSGFGLQDKTNAWTHVPTTLHNCSTPAPSSNKSWSRTLLPSYRIFSVLHFLAHVQMGIISSWSSSHKPVEGSWTFEYCYRFSFCNIDPLRASSAQIWKLLQLDRAPVATSCSSLQVLFTKQKDTVLWRTRIKF